MSYALAEAMDDGHCGLPFEELVPLTEKLLDVPAELVQTALNLELEGSAVVADLEGRHCLFLAALYRVEREIAGRLTGGLSCCAAPAGNGS
jgi:exodeoxyribonuclease V alpha subunit